MLLILTKFQGNSQNLLQYEPQPWTPFGALIGYSTLKACVFFRSNETSCYWSIYRSFQILQGIWYTDLQSFCQTHICRLPGSVCLLKGMLPLHQLNCVTSNLSTKRLQVLTVLAKLFVSNMLVPTYSTYSYVSKGLVTPRAVALVT